MMCIWAVEAGAGEGLRRIEAPRDHPPFPLTSPMRGLSEQVAPRVVFHHPILPALFPASQEHTPSPHAEKSPAVESGFLKNEGVGPDSL